MGEESFRSYNAEQPNQLRLLVMLHNIGATESSKALGVKEITEWTRLEASELQTHLNKLIELGYVQTFRSDGIKYYLTVDGIRKVLSLYS